MIKITIKIALSSLIATIFFGICSPAFAGYVDFGPNDKAMISAATPTTAEGAASVDIETESKIDSDISCAALAGEGKGREFVFCVAGKIIRWLYGISAFLTVIMIIVAGFGYLTSAGNPSKVETAKKALAGAIIGSIITLSSYAIAVYIERVLSGNAPTRVAPAPSGTGSGTNNSGPEGNTGSNNSGIGELEGVQLEGTQNDTTGNDLEGAQLENQNDTNRGIILPGTTDYEFEAF